MSPCLGEAQPHRQITACSQQCSQVLCGVILSAVIGCEAIKPFAGESDAITVQWLSGYGEWACAVDRQLEPEPPLSSQPSSKEGATAMRPGSLPMPHVAAHSKVAARCTPACDSVRSLAGVRYLKWCQIYSAVTCQLHVTSESTP